MEMSAQCLIEAIQGETNAVMMYHRFAEQASADKLPNISKLFRMLAVAEQIHIKNHRRALGSGRKVPVVIEALSVQTTEMNILHAIAGERFECRTMYPNFFRKIRKELPNIYAKVAMLSMEWSSKVEARHAGQLSRALAFVKRGDDLPSSDLFLCRVCGNIEFGKPQKECEICGHDARFFMDMDRTLNAEGEER